MRKKPRLVLLVVALAAFALGLAACLSSDAHDELDELGIVGTWVLTRWSPTPDPAETWEFTADGGLRIKRDSALIWSGSYLTSNSRITWELTKVDSVPGAEPSTSSSSGWYGISADGKTLTITLEGEAMARVTRDFQRLS